MFITPLPQLLRLLLYTFLLGIALGALYDLFRIFKVAVLGGRQSERRKRESSASEKRRAEAEKGDGREADAKKRGRSRKNAPVSGQAKRRRKNAGRGFLRELPAFLLQFITDLLFFLIAAAVTVIFFYAFHRGKIRLSAIFSLAAGFALYYFTVGRLVYALAERIVNAVRLAVRFAFSHTVLPLCYAIGKGLAALYTALRGRILQRRAIALSEREEKAFLESAGRGFGGDTATIPENFAKE